MLAVEIMGYGRGHASYTSMSNDYLKHNEAVRYGWSTIYLMRHNFAAHKKLATLRYVKATIDARMAIPHFIPSAKRLVDHT